MRYLVILTWLSGCVLEPPNGADDDGPPPPLPIGCPAGETCSPHMPPGGLLFRRITPEPFSAGTTLPLPKTGIGGIEHVTVLGPGGLPFTQPFEVDVRGGTVAVESVSGPVVMMRGIAPGDGALRILDPTDHLLIGRTLIGGAKVDHVELQTDGESSFITDLAWAAREQTIPIAFGAGGTTVEINGGHYYENGAPVVDESAQVTCSDCGQPVWNRLELTQPTVGTRQVTFTTGSVSMTYELVVVDHADAIAPQPGTYTTVSTTTNNFNLYCFDATNQGRYVGGLDWSFDVTNATRDTSLVTRNCALLHPTATSGTATVTASAGGQSTTITLQITN